MAGIEGPVSCSKDDLKEAIELLNLVFIKLRGIKGDMAQLYPTFLNEENASNLYIIKVNKKIISFAGIKYCKLRYGNVDFNVALIGGVATHPEFRGKGYSTRILSHMNKVMEYNNIDFSLLWTGSPGFYKRLGWEHGGIEEKTVCTIQDESHINNLVNKNHVKTFAGQYNIIQALHDNTEYNYVVRSLNDTVKLLNCPSNRTLTAGDELRMEGYIVYRVKDESIIILESGGELNLFPVLIDNAGKVEGKEKVIIYGEYKDKRVKLLRNLGWNCETTWNYMGMIKIICRDDFFRKISASDKILASGIGQIYENTNLSDASNIVKAIFGCPDIYEEKGVNTGLTAFHGREPIIKLFVYPLDHV